MFGNYNTKNSKHLHLLDLVIITFVVKIFTKQFPALIQMTWNLYCCSFMDILKLKFGKNLEKTFVPFSKSISQQSAPTS